MNARDMARRLERLVFSRRAYRFVVRDWVALGDLQAAADVIGTMRFSRNLEPVALDGPSGQRLLVVAPHPDDEMIGPGGTLLHALDRGAEVRVLYLTRDPGEPGDVRRRETEAVARAVGYSTHFLDLPAGALSLETVARTLSEEVAAFKPDALFVPFMLDDHPEHRAASLVLVQAEAVMPERLEVWAYQVYTSLIPNVVVDITEVAERKAAAIRGWRDSAMRSRDWAHYALGLNAYNSRFLGPPPAARSAEAFFVLPLHEYRSLLRRYQDGARQ